MVLHRTHCLDTLTHPRARLRHMMTSFLSNQGLFCVHIQHKCTFGISRVLLFMYPYIFLILSIFVLYRANFSNIQGISRISRVFLCIEVPYVCQGYFPTITFQILRIFSLSKICYVCQGYTRLLHIL